LDGELVRGEVDVAPAQREQLAAPQAGVRRDSDEIPVACIVQRTSGPLVLGHLGRVRVAMRTLGHRTRERLDLLRRVERQWRALGLAAAVGEPSRGCSGVRACSASSRS
jgi:hypothetical protein